MELTEASRRELEPGEALGRRSLSVAIGRRLRELRQARSWSQDFMATRARGYGLNWTRSSLAKVERGERGLSIEEFLLLPVLVEVGLPQLIDGDDEWVQLTPGAAIRARGLRSLLRGSGGKLTKTSLPDFDLPWQREVNSSVDTLIVDDEAGFAKRVAALRRLATGAGTTKMHEGLQELLETLTLIAEPEPGVESQRPPPTKEDQLRGDRAKARVEAARSRMQRLWPDGTLQDGIWVELTIPDDATQKAARRLGLDPHDLMLLALRLWDRDLASERERRLTEQKTQSDGTSARRGHVTRTLLEELKAAMPTQDVQGEGNQ